MEEWPISLVRWKVSKAEDTTDCSDADDGILSPSFKAAGHDWRICYYPKGNTRMAKSEGFVSMYLHLASTPTAADGVTVVFDFTVVHDEEELKKHQKGQTFTKQNDTWGWPSAFERSKIDAILEKSGCVAVKCTVYTEDCGSIDSSKMILRRPGDIIEHLANLHENQEMTDAEFIVSGETFSAHKRMLASRPPVFKAQFYGPLAEIGSKAVTVGT